jgi:hypothetical protein
MGKQGIYFHMNCFKKHRDWVLKFRHFVVKITLIRVGKSSSNFPFFLLKFLKYYKSNVCNEVCLIFDKYDT